MKKLLITTLIAAVLTGCAAPKAPPTPAVLLSDVELCTQGGAAHQSGNVARFDELVNETQHRLDTGRFHVPVDTCTDYAQMGANQVEQARAQARAETAADNARWSQFNAGLQAAAAQINQQNAYQQQQQNIQIQQAQADSQRQMERMMDQQAADQRNRQLINAINGNGF